MTYPIHPTRSTTEYQSGDAAHHIHAFLDQKALNAEGPRVMVRGEGLYLWDNDGNKYLDGMSGLWCTQLGYSRQDLADAPDLADNAGRVQRVAEIDAAIGAWTQARSVQTVMDELGAARVPAGKVYTAKDIAEDPHYRAREMILTQRTRDGFELQVPGVVPKLSLTPGTVRSSAPHVGDDTDAVLAEIGLSAEQVTQLREKGIIQ